MEKIKLTLPCENTQKPLCHVQNWLDALFLEMSINVRRRLFEETKENVPVKLNGLHTGTVVSYKIFYQVTKQLQNSLKLESNF